MHSTNDSSNPLRNGFILLLLGITALGFLGMIHNFIVAILLAAIFAGLLYPFYVRILKLFWGRTTLASISTLTLALLILGVPLALLATIVISDAVKISQQLAPSVQNILSSDKAISERVPEWVPFISLWDSYQGVIEEKFADISAALGGRVVKYAATITQNMFGFFLGAFVMLYAMYFFLINGPEYLQNTKTLLPLSSKDRDLVMERGMAITRASLKGIILIGAAQGLLVGLAFWACGLNAPAFWGVITFVFSAIPGVGVPLIWMPAAAYLIVTGSMGWGIALVLWGGVVVGLVDNLLRPMLVSRDAKLPDLVILVSILGGLISFGAAGIFLGPIVVAVLDTVINIYRRAFTNSLPS